MSQLGLPPLEELPRRSDLPNALTFDVEEYFQVENLRGLAPPSSWESFGRRLPETLPALLDLLARHDTKATFFTLGWVAERMPELVRRIHDAGHEVACHGHSHQTITRQSPALFREETRRAKGLLEDAIGASVDAYRAATFSIVRDTIWALEILAEEGFGLDSSVVPYETDRYGIAGLPQGPFRWKLPSGATLTEIPVSSLRLGPRLWPMGGGGYFRLYPLRLTLTALQANKRRGLPAHLYFHPWEFDPAQPRMQAGRLSTFRHYHGLARTGAKLEAVMRALPMGTLGALWRAAEAA